MNESQGVSSVTIPEEGIDRLRAVPELLPIVERMLQQKEVKFSLNELDNLAFSLWYSYQAADRITLSVASIRSNGDVAVSFGDLPIYRPPLLPDLYLNKLLEGLYDRYKDNPREYANRLSLFILLIHRYRNGNGRLARLVHYIIMNKGISHTGEKLSQDLKDILYPPSYRPVKEGTITKFQFARLKPTEKIIELLIRYLQEQYREIEVTVSNPESMFEQLAISLIRKDLKNRWEEFLTASDITVKDKEPLMQLGEEIIRNSLSDEALRTIAGFLSLKLRISEQECYNKLRELSRSGQVDDQQINELKKLFLEWAVLEAPSVAIV